MKTSILPDVRSLNIRSKTDVSRGNETFMVVYLTNICSNKILLLQYVDILENLEDIKKRNAHKMLEIKKENINSQCKPRDLKFSRLPWGNY